MKSAQKLLADANSASKFISILRKREDKFEKKFDSEIYKIYNAETDEKSKIEKKFNKQRSTLEDEKTKTKETFTKSIDENYQFVNQVEKIVYFLKAIKKENDFDPSQIKNYEKYSHSQKVGRLYAHNDGDFLKLSYIMYETDRPKNKFALCILGCCKLGSHDSSDLSGRILDLPYAYGCHLQKDGNANIVHMVKHLPTQEAAKQYALNNPITKVLKKFLAQYELVKQECIEASKNYQIKDFEAYRLEKARKYFEHNSRVLSHYAERQGIKKDSWQKLTMPEKRKIMEDL